MELYEALIEHSVDGLLITRPDGAVLRASPSACRMLGRSEDELRRLGRDGLVVKDRRLAALLGEREATGVARGELSFLRQDGSAFTAEVTSAIIRTGSTRRYAYVIFRDLTERERSERVLRESEALHRTLFNLAPSGVVLSDRAGRMLAFNARAHEQLGYQREEFSRLALADVQVGDFPGDHEVRVGRALAGEDVEFEAHHRTRAGEIREVLVRMRPLPADGETRLLSVWHDVTEANLARRELARSEQRFRALIESASDMIVVEDAGGAVRFWSPSAAEALGWRAEEVTGRSILELVHPDDRGRLQEARVGLVAHGGVSGRFSGRCLHRNGSWRLVEVFARNLLDDPSVRGIVLNARDVSDQRALEEQSRHAQKMESIGRLAASVAHDFSNLLTVILSATETLSALPACDAPEVREQLREIAGAGESGRDLIRQLLGFARRGPSSPATVELNELVDESAVWLRRMLGADVELSLALAELPEPVRCAPGLLQQILLNLASNAREAMPQGGKLEIATERVVLADAQAARAVGLKPGGFVCLRVSDSGKGMAPEVKAHAFEPFFTTKPEGRAAGLGLATIYGIVGQHGGNVLLDSEPGRGTTVRVFLPEEPRASAPAPTAAGDEARGSETVLLLEDEQVLRDVAARALRAHGYRVLAAANGREALELVGSEERPVHLIVADMILPGPHGAAAAVELTRRCPAARVLYMSGYTLQSMVERGLLAPGVEFLEKPFAASELIARVRAILDRSGKAP